MALLTDKKARLRIYFWALLILAIAVATIDIYLAARILGFIAASFIDPMLQALLILGVYPAWKFDVLLSAIATSIIYTALTFSELKEWHKKLGIFSSDSDIILQLLYQSAGAAIISYLFFVVVLRAYLRFFVWFKNT